MDQLRTKKSKGQHRNLVIGMLTATVIGIGVTTAYWNAPDEKIRSELTLVKVKKGNLPQLINGFGKLKSADQRFITAQDRGVVENIHLMPGAEVTAESVILTLSNPDLTQALSSSQINLQSQQANLRKLKLQQAREWLDETQSLDELTLDHQVLVKTFSAKEKLAAAGIVSQLEFLKSQAELKKVTAKLRGQKKRLQQIQNLHEEAMNIEKETIKQKQLLVELAQKKINALSVKAGIKGTLQELPVKLGQSVLQGQQLVQLGGKNKLIALVKVPQGIADSVQQGMLAKVNTRGGIADAVVSRINPTVDQGNIEIELQLMGKLPSNAKPELNIEASIELAQLKDVLYLPLTSRLQANKQYRLYLLQPNGTQATLSTLHFGQISNQYIELKHGASLGQTIILDDLDNDSSEIIIKSI
ncbi:efflux RND transporter periplasmic adaptor subunit [Shewanella sp. 0m-8]